MGAKPDLEIMGLIAKELKLESSYASRDVIDALRRAPFLELVGRIEGDLRPFLAALAALPKFLFKPAKAPADVAAV